MAGRHAYTWLISSLHRPPPLPAPPSSLAKPLVLVFRGSARLTVSCKAWGLVIMYTFKVLV